MIGIWVCALILIAVSILIGRAGMLLCGWSRPSWLAGAVGFAVICVVCPLVIHLPGRGLTAALVVLALAVGSAVVVRRSMAPKNVIDSPEGEAADAERRESAPHLTALVVVVVALLVASLPFLFNEGTGVLGEGIYTNDHAAQLYWADWLANGDGPRPTAVSFGYPTGPQSVAAALSRATGLDLITTFNGLLLAIVALTALTALAALGGLMGAWRRGLVAVLSGLTYLGASFLAQSSFKETAMALFVLAFAVALTTWRERRASGWSLAAVVVALAAASVFTFSIPGLAWFGLGLGIWLAFELATGGIRIDLAAIRAWAGRHRVLLAAATVIAIGVIAIAIGPALAFLDKIDEVTASSGRLSSPVFPGEALGIWPEGDFRLVRGEVSGSLFATAFAAGCMVFALVTLCRRRDWGLLSVLIACGLIYAVARPLTEIHVEAKALVVAAPLAALVVLRSLLADRVVAEPEGDGEPGAGRSWKWVRFAAGGVFALAAAVSVLLALRAAPIGFDDRGESLERLAAQVEGKKVAFLGVDRFGGYWLRGTDAASPGGYVPNDVKARPEKVWQQGDPLDLDTIEPKRLRSFDYAITTSAAYQSSPPHGVHEVARDGAYVLWRIGKVPESTLVEKNGEPGGTLECGGDAEADGTAVVLPEPVVGGYQGWTPASPLIAPASATREVDLERGDWQVSMQYASQVPLLVEAGGVEVGTLAPSLEGMYLTSPGRGAFWPVGELAVDAAGPVEISVELAEPSGLQRALGVERRAWLGAIAFTPAGEAPADEPVAQACGVYVDRIVSAS